MTNKIKALQQKVAAKALTVMSRVRNDQRGELPYWVNVVMVIVITVILGIAVYTTLSPVIKTNIITYVNKIFSGII
jgi:hypothetical protein